MELTFENIAIVGQGKYPDFVQFERTEGEVFFLDSGLMFGTPSEKLKGDFSSPVWLDTNEIGPKDDVDITNLELKTLSGFGVVGSYTTPTKQRLIIYEFQQDISDYLNSGTISHTIDDPVSRYNLTLENPDIDDPERPGNIMISEESSLLSPGAKINFNFGAGRSEPDFEMGQFFVDRSNFTLASETASTDGRNTIGKVLGDQSVDESNEYWYAPVSESIKDLFKNAKLNNDEYVVENTAEQGWFNFTPNTDYVKALETMLEILPQWRIRELFDGTIIVGSPEYIGFEQNGVYTFYRNKDIFSRQITMDDAQAYSRVCVHTENFSNVIFKEVEVYSGWNLQTHRTLYVQVTNGLQTSDLQKYADELAERLSDAGKVESFTGPIRPHLQCGDEAIIIDDKGSKSLGLITEITHSFGKSGFFTDFTVDSGGTVGKGRLSDYINKISAGSSGQKAEVGWNDVNMNEYVNLCRRATISTSSKGYRYWPKENMIDGKSSYWEWDGRYEQYWRTDSFWVPSNNDTGPIVEIKLGQRSLVNKVKLYFGSKYSEEDPTVTNLPKGYRLQFWNNSFWVDLATVTHVTSGVGMGYIANPEPVHEFEAIETSAIRLLLTPTVTSGIYRSGYIREIEVWGNM